MHHPQRTVFDDTCIDSSGQPMFLGKPLGLQRFDRNTKPNFITLFKKQMDFMWRPERIDLTKDRADFAALTTHERFLFTKNIQYQIAMDTVIARGIDTLMPYVSLTEIEAAFKYWSFCEVLHSYSYTYILQAATPDAGAIFDEALRDPEIIKRGEAAKRDYDRLLRFSGGDVKKQILLTLMATQILEGLRFYVSFACTFALAEPPHAKMEGNAKIVREICRDENLHVDLTADPLRDMRLDPFEGFTEVWKECEQEMVEMWLAGVAEEEAWARYLFPEGTEIVNLNADSLSAFVRNVAHIRMTRLGLPSPFGGIVNPLPWIDKWLNGHLLQVSPQETEVESYRTGATQGLSGNVEEIAGDDQY